MSVQSATPSGSAPETAAEAAAGDRLAAFLASLGPEAPVRAWRRLQLPASVPPWTDAGLALDAGQEFTWLAGGRVVLAEALDLWVGPRLALWGRIGGRGPLLCGTRASATFRAPAPGRLELCVYQGEWADGDGTLATPVEAYAALSGGLDVTLIQWRGPAAAGLTALGSQEPRLAAEAARLAHPVETPAGWRYHPLLGPSEIFSAAEQGGRPVLRACAANDVGILRHPVDVPLDESTELAWRWRVDRLPATSAEDSLPTHDYLSLALEFETGRDLTWYWSAALEPGTAYACPLPHWNARETHLVVRSGTRGLGAWHTERRRVAEDHRHAVPGPLPARIVAVWLIAVSLFRHGVAEAAFADIELRQGTRCWRVA